MRTTHRLPRNPLEQLPELRPGQSLELLKELHILTRDGTINLDSRRKLKQVMHLVQFIEPVLRDVASKRFDGPVLVDHGAGKSYLGFLLYDLILRGLNRGWVVGVEARPDLVDRSLALASRLGFERMRFVESRVTDSVQPIGTDPLFQTIDVVTALHACDTATDDAIAFALDGAVSHVVLVPCCQAELARVLNAAKALSLRRTALAELWRHPLHTRELGSHLTNVLRCLYLEANGYRVRVTELVGWEHSMKNELIMATREPGRGGAAMQQFFRIVAELHIQAWARTRFPRLAWETVVGTDDAIPLHS